MPSMLVETILTPEDKRYRRCLGFGCCHVRTCVFVIGILELMTLAAAVVTLFVLYEMTAESFVNRNIRPQDQKSENLLLGNYVTDQFDIQNSNMTHRHPYDSSESSEEVGDQSGSGSGKGGKSSDSDESSEEEDMEREKDSIYLRAKHRYYVRSMVGAAGAFVVGVFVVALMFTGLVKRRPRLLLPHLGVQILAIIGLVIVIILYSVWCVSIDKSDDSKRHLYPINQAISCWLIIGSCAIALIFEMLSFWSVLVCYRYLCNLSQAELYSDTHHFLPNGTGKYDESATWASPRPPMGPGKRV